MKFSQNVFVWSCFLCVLLLDTLELISTESVTVRELKTGWTLTNQNSTITKRDLTIPSGVYSVLYGEDVLQSYNDIRMRWIAKDNWTYALSFTVNTSEHRNARFVNLTFHGIDTVAEIRLNHYLVGRTDNMFVRYSYDITKILQENNELEVEIKSPIYAALVAANQLLRNNKTVPPECPPKSYHGECHVNMLRKMQASFAWDWGLAAPSVGLWKSVALESYDVAVIRDVDVATSKNISHWNMQVKVFIDVGPKQDFYAELDFYAVELLEETLTISDYKYRPLSYKNPIITFELAIPIQKVVQWWPNGYGDQKLYPLHVTLNAWLDRRGPNLRAHTISNKHIRIGFRTIELLEEQIPEGNGNTFLFKVNGEEIFMKGTNYIPSHILPELGNDEDRIKHLLLAAKEANMNMIRVWGGGIYESDYFYAMADYYGILIWQDMMFACAMYPVTNAFLASVRVEISQNAKRIAHHPSIAIFAANNENEAALVQNWYGTLGERKRFEAEYRELYLATVMHELNVISHSSRPRPLVSSPSNGKEEANSFYISADPQDAHYGDVHFYDYFNDAWNMNIYPTPRFASEYGFQSFPNMRSWKLASTENDDLLKLIDHRQHHPLDSFPIIELIRRHLPLPLPEDANYAEALIYFSQISQAMATKTETERYRSLRDTENRTMGALYWQLNDVWVAPSWSSIDFYGNLKILHHWAKDFMAAISIIAHYDVHNKAINIILTCDDFEVDTNNLTVSANMYLWSDLYAKNTTTWPVTLKANGVQYDKVIPIRDFFIGLFTKSNSFIEFTLQRNSKILSRTYYFPTTIAATVGITDPEVTLDISPSYCSKEERLGRNDLMRNSYSLTISVTHPALFVHIEILHPKVLQYKLSRNGWMQLSAVQMVHLEFESDECINIQPEDVKILTVNQFVK